MRFAACRRRLWDCGLRVSPITRTPGECERFEATNPEFGLSLLDFRELGGATRRCSEKMREKCLPRLMKDAKAILAELGSLTRERHAKYGNTLFHLEPNIKDCPGGLRDAHVSEWLRRIRSAKSWRSAGMGRGVCGSAELSWRRCAASCTTGTSATTTRWTGSAQDAAAESGRRPVAQVETGARWTQRTGCARTSATRAPIERRLLRECEMSRRAHRSAGAAEAQFQDSRQRRISR